jgi:hypothetical protein
MAIIPIDIVSVYHIKSLLTIQMYLMGLEKILDFLILQEAGIVEEKGTIFAQEKEMALSSKYIDIIISLIYIIGFNSIINLIIISII